MDVRRIDTEESKHLLCKTKSFLIRSSSSGRSFEASFLKSELEQSSEISMPHRSGFPVNNISVRLNGEPEMVCQ